MIPKGGGCYHIIDLVDVVWKVVTVILNRCFTASTVLDDVLHGFREFCSTGNASLEAKLPKQLTAMKDDVL